MISRCNIRVVVLLLALVVGGCSSDRILEAGLDGTADVGVGDVAGPGADAVRGDTEPDDAGGADQRDTTSDDGGRALDAAPDAAGDADDDAIGDAGGDSDAADLAEDVRADDTAGSADVAPDDAAETGDTAPPEDAGQADDTPAPPALLDVTVEATMEHGWWDHVERLWLDHDALTPETFIGKTRQSDADIVAAFDGDAAPPPERFLLHAAPGWDTAAGPPVLLVHGAGSNADQSFVDPDPLGAAPGLAPSLAENGFSVFAVSFPARYGDNLNQALAIAAALQRIRVKTGAAKVDVFAHSKGGIALVAYLAGMLDDRGVPYQGDVRRVILAGVPLGGMDFSFRHPSFNYSSAVWGYELPSSWDQLLLYGAWQDRYEDSIYGGAYTGLLQTLARWDDVHSLSMTEQDWYTTYEGGYGFVSHSLGIDAAIDLGGRFIERMRAGTLPDGLPVAVLVGTSPYVGITPWELTGPSDGLVFTASAGDTDWLEAAGATVASVLELDGNHWDLVYAAEARAWIRDVLAAE